MSEQNNERMKEISKKFLRGNIRVNKAKSYAEAEEWDVEFWMTMTPEERIAALEELREEAGLFDHETD